MGQKSLGTRCAIAVGVTIPELQTLLDTHTFDHATYRHHGTLWEGLWIYARDPQGFRGYSVAGCFPADSAELDAAYALVCGTGISVGAYGRG